MGALSNTTKFEEKRQYPYDTFAVRGLPCHIIKPKGWSRLKFG